MKKLFLYTFLLFSLCIISCQKDNSYTIYHSFKGQTWARFNKLQYEIPINVEQQAYDVVFFTRVLKDYPYDYLDFNMVMTTPSGEDRIKEYRLMVKDKTGAFLQPFTGDSVEYIISLKKGITLTKGKLVLEIENLIPRLETTGILGAGIRLTPLR